MAALLAMFVLYALVARFALHGEVTRTSLHESVTDASGSSSAFADLAGTTCRRAARPRTWDCAVLVRSGSGNASYRARVRPGSSCWRARLTSNPDRAGLPTRLDGCVRRWPWRLFGYL